MSDAFDYHDKYLYTCFVIIACCLFLISFSVYLVQQIIRFTGVKDLPLILSIISITVALICIVIFMSLDIVRILSLYDETINFTMSVYKLQQFDRLKVMFMFFAFVLDLYKWCVFIASTGKNVRADQNLFEERLKKIKTGLLAIQSSILVFSLTLIIIIFSVSEE